MVWVDDLNVESGDLGCRISGAFLRMLKAPILDEKVMESCLKEIKLALFQTHLQFELVSNFQNKVEKRVQSASDQLSKKTFFQEICYELYGLLGPGKLSFSLDKIKLNGEKRKTDVVLFVGLQGSGKTRACTQFANYYKDKKQYYPAIVSADTFGGTHFDLLMQGALPSAIPLYGSFKHSDAVEEMARSGVDFFKKRSYGPIIIDTSERHTDISNLFKAMSKLYDATKPDLVIFVVDSGIGLAAVHQLELFKQTFKVGAVILTGVNYDRKGTCEAFSAIAATKTPIMFIAREGLEEFERFDIKSFVGRLLLGRERPEFKEDLDIYTNYTLRVYHIFQHIYDPKEFSWTESIEEDRLRKLHILNSMKTEDLDGRLRKLLSCSFILRIAKASGSSVTEVLLLMEDHKVMVGVLESLCDDFDLPVHKYFDKIFPGVIMDTPARRKRIEAGEDLDEPTKEELMQISKYPHSQPSDSKRVRKFKREKLRDLLNSQGTAMENFNRQDYMAEKIKWKSRRKQMEKEAAKLGALYGTGKPLPIFEAKEEDGEGSKMEAAVNKNGEGSEMEAALNKDGEASEMEAAVNKDGVASKMEAAVNKEEFGYLYYILSMYWGKRVKLERL